MCKYHLDSQQFSHFCIVRLKSSYDATVTLKSYRHIKEATNVVSTTIYFHGEIQVSISLLKYFNVSGYYGMLQLR